MASDTSEEKLPRKRDFLEHCLVMFMWGPWLVLALWGKSDVLMFFAALTLMRPLVMDHGEGKHQLYFSYFMGALWSVLALRCLCDIFPEAYVAMTDPRTYAYRLRHMLMQYCLVLAITYAFFYARKKLQRYASSFLCGVFVFFYVVGIFAFYVTISLDPQIRQAFQKHCCTLFCMNLKSPNTR